MTTVKVPKPIISERLKYNLIYFLYCCYEWRYKKILLNNCGYHPSALTIDNALQFQLYLELIKTVKMPLDGSLDICEIGCGQGHGGVFLFDHYFSEQTQYTGIDISDVAIAYCRRKYKNRKNMQFLNNRPGSQLPCGDGSFDLIFGVEPVASRRDEYLQELHRCLKASGHFIFMETYNITVPRFADQRIERNGFEIVSKENITEHIVQAFVADNQRKLDSLKKLAFLPEKQLAFLRNFIGTVDSSRFNSYCNGTRNGFIYTLRKAD